MRRILLIALAFTLLPVAFTSLIWGGGASARDQAHDFLVLALTWSPSYCKIEGDGANRQQCAEGRNLGFVVHGLWPQFESGWPEYCRASGPSRVPNSLVRQYLDIMPSAGLMGHQWRKHGTCTGLDQNTYFRRVRAARERIAIPARFKTIAADFDISPDRLEADFIDANPGMRSDGIAISCAQRHLAEVRICLSNDLEFRPCPEIDARGCRLPRAAMPAPD